jgi:hypothetical protein
VYIIHTYLNYLQRSRYSINFYSWRLQLPMQKRRFTETFSCAGINSKIFINRIDAETSSAGRSSGIKSLQLTNSQQLTFSVYVWQSIIKQSGHSTIHIHHILFDFSASPKNTEACSSKAAGSPLV